MSATFGDKIKITLFGQSRSESIGCVIDGFPVGITPDYNFIKEFCARRLSTKNQIETKRHEKDSFKIISGLNGDGKTCGAPICVVIDNNDLLKAEIDNTDNGFVPRPSHSDYPAYVKFGVNGDFRGGGFFSGRLTAPLCVAGALCLQVLKQSNINILTHIYSLGTICDTAFPNTYFKYDSYKYLENKSVPVIDDSKVNIMLQYAEKAAQLCDSVGGIIECAITGMPAGIGGTFFDGMESVISKCVFSIPGVKGVEFGAGFGISRMNGSQSNDPLYSDNGVILTESNNSGGINGGLSNGMPVVFRAAFRPASSISVPQKSVDMKTNENTVLRVVGRNDACYVFRAAVCVSAASAIAVINML